MTQISYLRVCVVQTEGHADVTKQYCNCWWKISRWWDFTQDAELHLLTDVSILELNVVLSEQSR